MTCLKAKLFMRIHTLKLALYSKAKATRRKKEKIRSLLTFNLYNRKTYFSHHQSNQKRVIKITIIFSKMTSMK